MNNANEAAVDARAITQQMAKNKEINDELLQKWIKTYPVSYTHLDVYKRQGHDDGNGVTMVTNMAS